MTQPFRVLSAETLADQWGLEAEVSPSDEETSAKTPKRWGLAEIIRCELRRRGAVTRRELRKRLTPILDAAGFGPQSIDKARELADEMAQIGELSHVRIDGQKGWASRPSRWLRVGNNLAAVLGVAAIRHIISRPNQNGQYVRRFDPIDDAIVGQLSAQGIHEEPIEKWIGTPDWHQWVDSTNATTSLDELWRFQVCRLQERGDPFDPTNSSLLCIGPAAGDFFGRPTLGGQGRWVSPSQLPNGIYLGAQIGYSESHWRPLIIELSDGKGISLLLDGGKDSASAWQLLRWLLIARGIVIAQEERVEATSYGIQLTFPLPEQLRRYLTLVAENGARWKLQPAVGFDPEDWRSFFRRVVSGP